MFSEDIAMALLSRRLPKQGVASGGLSGEGEHEILGDIGEERLDVSPTERLDGALHGLFVLKTHGVPSPIESAE
jgi:hypothetical protein